MRGRLRAGAQQRGRLQALGGVLAAKQGAGAQQRQALANVGLGFFGDGRLYQGNLRLAHLALQGFDGIAAHGRQRAEQLQGGQGVVDFAAQAVVHHRIRRAGQHLSAERQGGAGGGIQGFAIAQHHGRVGHNFYLALREGLQVLQGLGFGRLHQRRQGGDALVRLAHRNR